MSPKVTGSGVDPGPVFPWERRGSCALGRQGHAGSGAQVPAHPRREEVTAARSPCPGVTLSRSIRDRPRLYFRAGSCPARGTLAELPGASADTSPAAFESQLKPPAIRAAPAASALPTAPTPRWGVRRDPGAPADPPKTLCCPSQARAPMHVGSPEEQRHRRDISSLGPTGV